MNTILVPTDFSPSAENALRVAALIARHANAELYLLHSVKTDVDWDKLPVDKRANYPETQSSIIWAEDLMAREVKKPMLKGLTVHTNITFGSPYEKIVQFATKKINADLIVMGSHGPDEPDELFIGSNAQKTLRFAHCPVLTVKKSFSGKSFRKIVFASDFEENVTGPFNKILEVARALKAKMEIVFINTPSDFKDNSSINQIMDAFIAKYPDVKFTKSVYNDYLPDKGILHYSMETQPDMISLVTHGKRHIPHYLLGVTETLVYHSEIPVMSMNIK